MSMYIGEALTGDGNEVAHIDLLIGNKDGPVGVAFANALAKACPTGPALSPISRSMCATSLPSPTSASPMYIDMAGPPLVLPNCLLGTT